MKSPATLLPPLALLVLGACAPSAPPEVAVASEPPPAVEPAPTPPAPSAPPRSFFAPSPYDADLIREASPDGRVCVMQVTDPKGVVTTRMEYSEADETGVTIRSSTTAPGGRVVGVGAESRNTWDELVKRALYRAGRTTITSVEVTVQAGTFPAKLYEVRDGSGKIATRAWFADGFGGPPVKLQDLTNGEVVRTIELIEHVLPSPG